MSVNLTAENNKQLPELVCLGCLCLAARLPWLFMLPMVEAPDEFSHYWVVRFLFENRRLPSASAVLAGKASAVYGSLPQLGYLPHILMAKLLPIASLPLASRFGSLLMGLVTVVFAYFIGRRLFGGQKLLALAIPLAIIFHPQLVFVNSYTNNDSTVAALGAMIMLVCLRLLQEGSSFKDCLYLGILLAWMALSKYSGYAVYPACCFAFFAAAWLHRQSLSQTLLHLCTIVVLLFTGALWWFIREASIFPGDLLGTKTMRYTWALTYNRPLIFHENVWHIIKEKRWWRLAVFSFWGLFGYMTRFLWRPFYIMYIGFMVTAIMGGIKQSVKCLCTAYGASLHFIMCSFGRENKTFLIDDLRTDSVNVTGYIQSKEYLITYAIWSTFVICLLSNFGAMLWASALNLGGPQGRYLFVSELPVIAMLIAGLVKVSDRYGKNLVKAFLVFNFIVYCWSFIMLSWQYGLNRLPL